MTNFILITMVLTVVQTCAQRDKEDAFSRITFHTSTCYGTCPRYHMLLEPSGAVKVHRELVYRKGAVPYDSSGYDTGNMGYFTGQAADTSMDKLKSEIIRLGVDTMTFEGPMYTDGPEITIVINRNGKQRKLKSSSPTPRARNLIASLYEICETPDLAPADKPFRIE
jgi:hypothetical protein